MDTDTIILNQLVKEKVEGVCPVNSCGHRFLFSGKFIIEETTKHVFKCKKLRAARTEKRGGDPWQMTNCEKCGTRFGWEIAIYKNVEVIKKGKPLYQDYVFSLTTKKAFRKFYKCRDIPQQKKTKGL